MIPHGHTWALIAVAFAAVATITLIASLPGRHERSVYRNPKGRHDL